MIKGYTIFLGGAGIGSIVVTRNAVNCSPNFIAPHFCNRRMGIIKIFFLIQPLKQLLLYILATPNFLKAWRLYVLIESKERHILSAISFMVNPAADNLSTSSSSFFRTASSHSFHLCSLREYFQYLLNPLLCNSTCPAVL